MPTSYSPRRRALARLLLPVLLMQFTGAVFGPWLHAASMDAAPCGLVVASSDAPGQQPDGPAPAPHDEQNCRICQAFTALALPGSAPLLAWVPEFRALLAPDAPPMVGLAQSVVARARAPPPAAA